MNNKLDLSKTSLNQTVKNHLMVKAIWSFKAAEYVQLSLKFYGSSQNTGEDARLQIFAFIPPHP